jgi:hypothetical protein
MFELPPQHLVRLRTRAETLYVSQNRTVLATRRDGFINAEPDHGFFVRSTRLLSRYEYQLNGKALFPNGLSNVEQHSWLGYYVAPAPDARQRRHGAFAAWGDDPFSERRHDTSTQSGNSSIRVRLGTSRDVASVHRCCPVHRR